MSEDLDENNISVSDDEDNEDLLTINIPSFASKYITEDKLNDFFNFKDTSAINLMHVNCRSLKKNFSSLNNLIYSLSGIISALAVTETWLTESLQDVYNIPGYNFISIPRIGKTGGGVGLYLKNSFDYTLRSDLCRTCEYIECLFVEIRRAGKQPIFIGCVYRPPNSDIPLFISELQQILSIIDCVNNKLAIIAGDFNLNLLKYNSHVPTGDFLNSMLSYNFVPTICQPTRITEFSASLIDNIFVHSTNLVYNSAIVYSDISDHLVVAIHLNTSLPKPKIEKNKIKRSFDTHSLEAFNSHLANTDWSEMYDMLSVNSDPSKGYDLFFNKYKSIFDQYFPERLIKLPNSMIPRHDWMTKGLMKSCVKKSKLYRKYCNNRTKANKDKYTAYREKLKTLLRIAEKNYYSNKFTSISGNIKETWKLLGKILNKDEGSKIVDCFTDNGVEITDKNEIVNKFNDYFVNIGCRLASAIPNSVNHFSSYLNTPTCNSFCFFPTDDAEIVRIVTELNNKWSAGYDAIPVNIMKSSIRYIAEPISRLINSSFSNGIFPNCLKVAKVCPIYKSGAKNTFTNYRPISILPSFSKIYEKAVSLRLMTFLEAKCNIIDNQYGFRSKRSTYMALMQMYDKISSAIDNNEYSVGIFIDLSKAFDTLNHKILLKKLENYGIRGIALKWFHNYLQDRKQYVFLNGISSTLKSIVCGVPQGSILGPLLFIIYINDIVNCSKLLKFILFADDTNLFYSNSDLAQLQKIVNSELTKLSDWFCANKLSLNVVKTNYMLFGYKPIPKTLAQFKLFIDGNNLERVSSTKFLGVFVDEKLKWDVHVNYVASKMSKGLGMLGRVRNLLPFDALRVLYHTLIYPYLLYCSIIWAGAAAATLNRLIVLQNRAVRLITSSPFRASASPIYKQLNLLPLVDIRRFQQIIFMFKCKHKLLPDCCLQYCPININKPYHTRCSYYFTAPAFRTNIREQSISVLGPRLWNTLPSDLINSNNLSHFKRLSMQYFLANY